MAAQGRSLKVVMLRTYLALLGAAQKAYEADGGKKNPANAADPYMTLLGYFNSLRELGGSRRIVEDEVTSKLSGYGTRKRIGQAEGLFANRTIAYEVVELTSREPTNKVAEAKRRLAVRFPEKERVDVAIATNMISVGLDITRLGLMVVLGQPKTCAEYIQATSRVGRDPDRPGLVVTLLNIHRPRDRSHFERFEVFHQSFYRTVEATSVTPFSPRALDRGLAGTLVALARLGHAPMTPPKGATEILQERSALDFAVQGPVGPGRRACPPGGGGSRGVAPVCPQPDEQPVRRLEPDRPRLPKPRDRLAVQPGRSGSGQAAAARLPRPRAEDYARPAQAIPDQSLDARRRAERQPLAENDGRRGDRTGGRGMSSSKAKHKRPHGQVRQSQLVTTFGPGALFDLPDYSVIVGGLEYWSRGDQIIERRLEAKLMDILGVPSLALYAPPPENDDPISNQTTGITSWQFPGWYITQGAMATESGARPAPAG